MSDGGAAVRVRGVYATALTELLTAGDYRVVQASRPIRERFDASFPDAPADVVVATTRDRQGVGVRGAGDAVASVADDLRVARDVLDWPADAPCGAVFRGTVTDSLGSGALLSADGTELFLPYDAAADYVGEGDRLRVQVREPRPPWDDDRPGVATDLRVETPLVTLVRGDADAGGRHLGDLLPVEPPDGWTARWSSAAEDADLDALAAALETATGRAEALMTALADAPDEDGPLARPVAGRWVWFGRAARFALDDHRRAVTATMAGHHRVKAATGDASRAVDLVEAVCETGDGDFPFDAVTRTFGPREGDRVAIAHGKPDGRCLVLGRGEVVDREPDGGLTVRRELTAGGSYDGLGVERQAGDVAVTKVREGRWWYPTVYRGADGERRGTYVNVCTPVEVFPDAVRYVDLHVDVVKHADGTVERVDDDELDAAVAAGHVSAALAEKARAVAATVVEAL